LLSFHTEALVLRAVDFGESDRIVHLLTPAAGRLPAIAKGARRSRRRFPGTLDLFNQLAVQVVRSRPGALARLEGARLLRTFESIRAGAERFALGCYLLELLDRLAPEGGAPRDLARLFAFARGALDWLDREPPSQRMRVLLELRALDALGLRPELLRCVRCGRELAASERSSDGTRRPLLFLIGEGGALCSACAPDAHGAALPIHLGTLRALDRALRFPLDQLGRLALAGDALAEAQRLLTRFLGFHVGVELQSRRVLEELTLPGGEGKLPPPRQGPRDASEPGGSGPRREPMRGSASHEASEGDVGSECS
jgi:DNA repair protein RecO (recombination protein O)